MCDTVAGLTGSVERLRGRRRVGRSPAQLGRELKRLRHLIDLVELEFATVAGEYAASDECDLDGAPTAVEWIRHECRMSMAAASQAVAVGEQAERLPESIAALEEGRLGYGHLALVARTAAYVRGRTGRFAEASLLNLALEHSVSRFRFDCAHARHAADAEAYLNEQNREVAFRRLELTPCGNGGSLSIHGQLDPAAGASLRSALEPLARKEGPDDERSRERRLADALVELVNHCLDQGQLPRVQGQRPHLQVTTSLETLIGLAGAPAGELEFSVPIAAATVQRLACDASVVRVLLGSDSQVIDVGRARRLPSGPTRRALRVRDGGCVWPGCDRPASWTQAHHIVHWGRGRGGPTDLANLVLLCYRHHWRVHEGGWQIVRTAEGKILTIAPRYRLYRPLARAPDFAAA